MLASELPAPADAECVCGALTAGDFGLKVLLC